MTDKQDTYECPYKGDCELVGCMDHKDCFIKQLFEDRFNAEVKLYDIQQECDKMAKGYSELVDIVTPYMDDFTGYNEELGGFDIVLCVKELLQQMDIINDEKDMYKKQWEIQYDLCGDWCDTANKFKKALKDIYNISKPFCEECKEFALHNKRDCMYCNYGKIIDTIEQLGIDFTTK